MSDMKTVQEITRDYIVKQQKLDTLRARIVKKQEQIERLKGRVRKTNPSWTQDMLKPFVEEVEKQLPEVEFKKDECYTPMGLCSRVSIFPKYKGETLMIQFIPLNLTTGVIGYETGVVIEEYPKGSIGELNGMGREYVSIESVQQVVDFLKEQMKKIDNS